MNEDGCGTVGFSTTQAKILWEVAQERNAQDIKFPDQRDLPDGTGGDRARSVANTARAQCEAAGVNLTWKDILREEYAEAVAESDRAKLRAELIQVAAICVKWIEALDARAPEDA